MGRTGGTRYYGRRARELTLRTESDAARSSAENLYALSNVETRSGIIDSRAASDFCEVEFSNHVPDENTIGRFRNLLIANGIHENFFEPVVVTLKKRGLILKKGRIGILATRRISRWTRTRGLSMTW